MLSESPIGTSRSTFAKVILRVLQGRPFRFAFVRIYSALTNVDRLFDAPKMQLSMTLKLSDRLQCWESVKFRLHPTLQIAFRRAASVLSKVREVGVVRSSFQPSHLMKSVRQRVASRPTLDIPTTLAGSFKAAPCCCFVRAPPVMQPAG